MKEKILQLSLLIFILFSFSACGADEMEYDFTEVSFGNLDQVVSATGFLQAQEKVNLAMEIGGKISNVLVDVGDEVKKGDVLVQLASSDVAMQLVQAEAGISSAWAQIKQAEANLDMQNALLADIKIGSSEESIKVAEIAVVNAEEALENLELELINTETLNENSLDNLYTTAVSLLEKTLTSSRNSLYTLTELQYKYFNDSKMIAVEIADAKELAVLSLLGVRDAGRWINKYLNETCDGLCAVISSLRENEDSLVIDSSLENMFVTLNNLKDVYLLIPMDGTLNTTDKITVNNEKTALDSLITNISAKQQEIILKKTTNQNTLDLVEGRYKTTQNTLLSAIANLDLVKSGVSDEQILAKEAGVAQADAALMMQRALLEQSQAAYDSLLVNLEKYRLTAAFDGIITEQLAKEGEIAAPQMKILSLMTNNEFEIEASIRETDIDKVKIGNKASIEFDALSEEVFLGEIIFIDPAENVQQGVIYYNVKITLEDENENNARLKSGMTADIDIITASKEDVMYLPMGVITYKGGKAYVSILEEGDVIIEEIQIGIESSGYVEVINDLKPGDKVISSFID